MRKWVWGLVLLLVGIVSLVLCFATAGAREGDRLARLLQSKGLPATLAELEPPPPSLPAEQDARLYY